MLNKLIMLPMLIALITCSSSKTDDGTKTTDTSTLSWRYFDRELYMPTGVSVQPEMASAQELIQASLTSLADQSDLGTDYFIFKYEEDSLLQPVTEETSYEGRDWYSFVQVWNDELFADYASTVIGTPGDEDVLVVRNELNTQEYFIIFRLSCFVSGKTCGYPTQAQSKAMVWRAMGYLAGLRNSKNSNSAIMKPGVAPEQENADEIKKYISEFDGLLERIRNKLPDAQ